MPHGTGRRQRGVSCSCLVFPSLVRGGETKQATPANRRLAKLRKIARCGFSARLRGGVSSTYPVAGQQFAAPHVRFFARLDKQQKKRQSSAITPGVTVWKSRGKSCRNSARAGHVKSPEPVTDGSATCSGEVAANFCRKYTAAIWWVTGYANAQSVRVGRESLAGDHAPHVFPPLLRFFARRDNACLVGADRRPEHRAKPSNLSVPLTHGRHERKRAMIRDDHGVCQRLKLIEFFFRHAASSLSANSGRSLNCVRTGRARSMSSRNASHESDARMSAITACRCCARAGRPTSSDSHM